jgi:3-dehydroquinate dehydratase-2
LADLQSNHEGALIDRLERLDFDGAVINPGALGHTSYALRDAVEGVAKPVVEIHITDVFAREPFRQVLLLEPVVIGQVVGHGVAGYFEAIDLLIDHLESRP